MKFDSHVMTLLDATVGLVNGFTPGSNGGRPVVVPTGRELTEQMADVLTTAHRPRITRAQATALIGYAVRARAVVEALDAGDLDTAAGLVNTLLEETATRPRLDHVDGEGWNLHFHGPDDSVDRGWAAGIAAGLALALGSDLAGRLGVCSAPACDRIYVDTSTNAGRRFCSTRCQSRVKAAAHRARTR